MYVHMCVFVYACICMYLCYGELWEHGYLAYSLPIYRQCLFPFLFLQLFSCQGVPVHACTYFSTWEEVRGNFQELILSLHVNLAHWTWLFRLGAGTWTSWAVMLPLACVSDVPQRGSRRLWRSPTCQLACHTKNFCIAVTWLKWGRPTIKTNALPDIFLGACGMYDL